MRCATVLLATFFVPKIAGAAEDPELLVTPLAYSLSGSYTVSLDNQPPRLQADPGLPGPQARSYVHAGSKPGVDDESIWLNDKAGAYTAVVSTGAVIHYFTESEFGEPLLPVDRIIVDFGAGAGASDDGGAPGPIQAFGIAQFTASFRTDRWIRCELSGFHNAGAHGVEDPYERASLRTAVQVEVLLPDGENVWSLGNYESTNEEVDDGSFLLGAAVPAGSIVFLKGETFSYATVTAPGDSVGSGSNLRVTLEISDPGYAGCNAADLAIPYGVFDYSDFLVFVEAFQAEDPIADYAPPLGVFSIEDIIFWVLILDEGCDES